MHRPQLCTYCRVGAIQCAVIRRDSPRRHVEVACTDEPACTQNGLHVLLGALIVDVGCDVVHLQLIAVILTFQLAGWIMMVRR